MIKKSDIVREAVQKQDWKKALQIAKDFHIGVTQEERDKMARAYECIVHPDFYRQIGTDIPEAIEQGKTIVKEYAESRRKNIMMKWDVKHDRAKRVIDHFLDNAGYWQEVESLTDGLTEEEKGLVNEEVNLMIESIRKRYKLQERLPEQTAETKQETEVQPETPVEEAKEETTEERPAEPEKEEKPKRGRRPAGEKKETARKPRAKKTGKEETV
ncbi:MAG: hypothetical protein IJL07_08990 [Lachnospiraceae bacterium]|nr:hypothetical protein [Lachnospiraceae bacterium]